MKTKTFFSIALAAVTMTLTSCGSGGSSSKVADDGAFANLPSITADYLDKGMDLFKDLTAAKDDAARQELLVKAKELEQQGEDEYAAAAAAMKDKEIPTEASADVPLEITAPFKLDPDAKTELGVVNLIAEVKTSRDLGDWHDPDYYHMSYTEAVLVDGEGQPVAVAASTSYKTKEDAVKLNKVVDPGKAGTEATLEVKVRFKQWNTEGMGKVKKIVLYSRKSDVVDATRKAQKEAEKAYDEQLKQMMQGEQ